MFFLRSQLRPPKLTSSRIKPDTLRAAHSKSEKPTPPDQVVESWSRGKTSSISLLKIVIKRKWVYVTSSCDDDVDLICSGCAFWIFFSLFHLYQVLNKESKTSMFDYIYSFQIETIHFDPNQWRINKWLMSNIIYHLHIPFVS